MHGEGGTAEKWISVILFQHELSFQPSFPSEFLLLRFDPAYPGSVGASTCLRVQSPARMSPKKLVGSRLWNAGYGRHASAEGSAHSCRSHVAQMLGQLPDISRSPASTLVVGLSSGAEPVGVSRVLVGDTLETRCS